MPPRICGEHCPRENVHHSSTKYCRICKHSFYLPCYDVIEKPSKIFVNNNIVFICDACLDSVDNDGSPERKRKITISVNNENGSHLRQSILSAKSSGGIEMPQELQSNGGATSKNATNKQIYELLLTVAKKAHSQSSKIDELRQNVCAIGNDVVETKKKTNDVYNIVLSRAQKWNDWANEARKSN